MTRPTVPPNRVLREGDLPCRLCGSGPSDHEGREHDYESHEMFVEWIRNWFRTYWPNGWMPR